MDWQVQGKDQSLAGELDTAPPIKYKQAATETVAA